GGLWEYHASRPGNWSRGVFRALRDGAEGTRRHTAITNRTTGAERGHPGPPKAVARSSLSRLDHESRGEDSGKRNGRHMLSTFRTALDPPGSATRTGGPREPADDCALPNYGA